MKKKLSVLLLLATLICVAVILIENFPLLQEKFDYKKYEKLYYKSQWAIPNSKEPISDEILATYAGYKYINGENPILIYPEAPPLGKYLIGLSILIFNNQNIIPLAISLLNLLLICYIVFCVTKSYFAASLASFLAIINTIFIDQFNHPTQLESFQLFFLLLLAIFFVAYQQRKKNWLLILSGILLGCFLSIKTLTLFWLVGNATLIIFYYLNKHKLKVAIYEILFINFFALLTFTLFYFQYFIHGGSFRGFLGVQKWVFLFYRSSKIDTQRLFGNYLSLLMFNRWRFWTKDYPIINYENWSILWPIVFITGVFSAIKLWLEKNHFIIFMLSFLIVYNLFMLFVPIFPRYFVLLFIPFNILIATYCDRILKFYE